MGENKKIKILIAEDDGFLAEIYLTKLKLSGYEVSQAWDGVEVLEYLKKNEVDFLLLDFLMPRMGGIEVLEEMRRLGKYKDLPVIVLTNAAEKENVDKAFELGARDYLVKSYHTPEEVVQKIKKVLNQ